MNEIKNDSGSVGNKSGFFPLEKTITCIDIGHNPPQGLYIPQGKGYRHVCSSCGKETVIIPPQITYRNDYGFIGYFDNKSDSIHSIGNITLLENESKKG